MLPLRPSPEPAPPSRGGRLFIVWLTAVLVVIGIEWVKPAMRRLHVPTGVFTFVEFLALLVIIALPLRRPRKRVADQAPSDAAGRTLRRAMLAP